MLLVRMCRGESHFSQKLAKSRVGKSGESAQHGSVSVGESGESAQHGLANVGESGESVGHGLANVGESGESQHQHETRRKCVREYSREYSQHSQNSHSTNLLSSCHCLTITQLNFNITNIFISKITKFNGF